MSHAVLVLTLTAPGLRMGDMGANHRWHIETPQPHTIRMQHPLHSGRILLDVGDRRIVDRRDMGELWGAGFKFDFEIDGIPCKLEIGGEHCHLWMAGEFQAESPGEGC